MDPVVDLNCDMGESFGAYSIGDDAEVIRYVTSSNIACGFHASDPNVMEKTVRLCRQHKVMVGAHPGYPDLLGFGRRFMDVGREELIHTVIYQVGALKGFVDLLQVSLQHVKLHGALYNLAAREQELFLDIARAVRRAFGDVIFLTLGTRNSRDLKRRCAESGIRVALEAFPDRLYTDEGELLSRSKPGAVLQDPAVIAERALRMVSEKGAQSASGKWIAMDIDTLCVHGDNRESIDAARMIRERARERGVTISPLASFL